MRAIALTFDDGPDPERTPAVLQALDDVGASATFFVIAPLAEDHPELISRILDGGHQIGVHCEEHVRHSDRDAVWGARDLDTALGRLLRLGVTPRRWRTPWGDQAEWTAPLARRANLELTGWSTDTHDWRGDRAEQMLAATRDGLVDGAVVLAHDGLGPGARRADVAQTVRYVALAAGHAATHRLRLAALT
jgi:peptidoglycan/xylan/chitin deacetylase (PgdA/CDA1 family)